MFDTGSMIRVGTIGLACTVLLGAVACKSDMKRAIELVPDDATVLVGVDVAALHESPLGRTMAVRVLHGELKEACSLGFDAWRSVVMGCDPDRYEETFVLVVSAEGIGTKTKLECLRSFAEKHLGRNPWTPREHDGRVELDIDFDNGTATGHVVDGNRLVIAPKTQDDAIRALIAGEGRSAATHGLADILARADTSRPLWVAAKVPAELPPGAPIAGAESVVASVGFPSDMVVSASVVYASSSDARARADAAQAEIDEIVTGLGALGIPAKTLQVDVTTRDERLEVSARLGQDVLESTLAASFGALR